MDILIKFVKTTWKRVCYVGRMLEPVTEVLLHGSLKHVTHQVCKHIFVLNSSFHMYGQHSNRILRSVFASKR
jgi:hypothetical protein